MAAPQYPPVYIVESPYDLYSRWNSLSPLACREFQVGSRRSRWYSSVEHAFQVRKVSREPVRAAAFANGQQFGQNGHPNLAETIYRADSPEEARRIARLNEHLVPASFYQSTTENRDAPSVRLMHMILRALCEEHWSVMDTLYRTGNGHITLLSDDGYWGKRPSPEGDGDRNMYGKVLMELRDRSREKWEAEQRRPAEAAAAWTRLVENDPDWVISGSSG
ncbi:hypothetical protein CALVIDRAFT_561695 [Calocera viscosa TUFC12733]|uniref:NADAR domain-containing protein n=1 Tax=Calocera viscosa (strain TUFC12733) TaxID=1330018 RepID=A0A167PFT8_CALVF|nr:hypothetical protein CALVIDRAFT_561695 [Calocera viscosa TUFC12733]